MIQDPSTELSRAEPDSVTAEPESRRIEVRLLSWGDVATSTEEGYRETFARGAFSKAEPSRVILESMRHGGPIVGVAEALEDREDGQYGTFRVAETPAGDELLALTRAGEGEHPVLRDASVVFRPVKSRTSKDGIVERLAADLRRVAIVERGAYPSAQVLAVRSEHPMSDSTQDPVEATPAPDLEPLMARMEALDSRMAELAALQAVPTGHAGQSSALAELSRFDSLSAYADAVFAGTADGKLLGRAAADQITTNNAGVLPPGWIQDVKRIVDLGRRGITAFGGPAALPATGMVVDWPYLGSSNTIIGEQSTEKTELTSARVDISKGEASLTTYAGYSDISHQLLQRSSPSYREAYNRIMLAEWGKVTDAAFCAALEGATGTTTQTMGGMLGANITLSTSAAADDIIDATSHGLSIGDAVVFTALTGGTGLTAGRVYWVIATSFGTNTFRVSATPGGAGVNFTADITAGTVAKVADTGPRLHEALAQASVSIEDAIGQPANVVLAGTDMFLMLAGLSGLTQYGPMNAQGSMLASTLRVEASGLLIQRAPGVSYGKILVSNREAADWYEDGPRFLEAEDVAKLGQNVAVYSFNAAAVYVPAAVVEATFI